MILGLGLDIVDVGAFREQLSDPASHFVEGSFTAQERETAASRPGADHARHLAVRYAAKEALIKAWSVARIGQAPALRHVDMTEIEVVHDSWKRPQIRLHGAVQAAVDELGPSRIHLSLSHDGGFAAAVVMLERVEE